MYGTKAT